MKRKYVGQVSKRYSVFKHVSLWDGNFRCDVWQLIYESNDHKEASNHYHKQTNGYYELTDHVYSQCLSATC